MYLWDTRGYTLENIYRVDQSPRLKNELLPAVSMPFRTVRIFATCFERRDRLRALGQKTLERFHYSRRGEGETRR